MKFKPLIGGALTFIPGWKNRGSIGTGGTDSAEYCYSVWLRHLVLGGQNGLPTTFDTIAELGPGDSLGIGLAALISGSRRYIAFDIVKHASAERNLRIFDELVDLFQAKAAIPGPEAFPGVRPVLQTYQFPASILDENRLSVALGAGRLDRIRRTLRHPDEDDSPLSYKVPWYDPKIVEAGSVDLIFSQAVLEHVDDLVGAYDAMRRWLRKDGFLSHVIDFRSHGLSGDWDGHWRYRDAVWKIMRGRRPYLLNREPYSTHKRQLDEVGFDIIFEQKMESAPTAHRSRLAPRFRAVNDADLATSAVFIQAKLRA